MRSKQIVYSDRPGIMKFLMHFMVPVNIHRKIRSDNNLVSDKRYDPNIMF